MACTCVGVSVHCTVTGVARVGLMLASYYTGSNCQSYSRAYAIMMSVSSVNCQTAFAIRYWAVSAYQ